MTNDRPPHRRRRRRLAASTLAASLLAGGADAFAPPRSPAAAAAAGVRRSPLAARIDEGDAAEVHPLAERARTAFAAASSSLLAASLLFANPLLPPPDAYAAPVVPDTATSIDVKLSSLPGLTRKALANRDKLAEFVAETLRPVYEAVSQSDAVTITPPKDVKGAVNQALTKGDATFLVNGQTVDVRLESVPGVVIVRVTNPLIPRLPFLRDGTAALEFVDDIVDKAPVAIGGAAEGIEKAAEEVKSVEKFLTWGAPAKAPLELRGPSFLSRPFLWNGGEVGLGPLGALTNGEAAFLTVGAAVGGAYGYSYSYYIGLQEKAEQAAEEKRKAMAAKKKAAAEKKKKAAAKAAAAEDAKKRKKKKEEEAEAARKAAEEEEKGAEYPPKPVMAEEEAEVEEGANAEAEEELTAEEGTGNDKNGRKRGVIKKLFRRGDKQD